MTKIGVISDTHDNLSAARKANEIFRREGVEYVFHLGDFTSPFTFREVFNGFESKGYCVLGNNDGEKILLAALANRMGVMLRDYPYMVEISGKKILLLHGFGPPENTLSIIRALASSGFYDLILYGHTHEPIIEATSATLIVNPGEASGVLTGRKTVAIVDLETMDARILELQP